MPTPSELAAHGAVQHPMGVVLRRTGLKADLIRMWERRYGVVTPRRSDTGRRLYSEADIERLKLLAALTDQGRRIGSLVGLDEDQLSSLLRDDRAAALPSPRGAPPRTAGQFLAPCLTAIRDFDGPGFQGLLDQALVELSRVHLVEELVAPLLHRVGELWHGGELRPSHEHLASAVVRTFLGSLRHGAVAPGAPTLVVTTPAGQMHELGALLVAATAATEGWQVVYLGPNLPAEEIAAATLARDARAVALSITYPPDDPDLPAELARLARLLPPRCTILVGGRSSAGYRATLASTSAIELDTLAALRRELLKLRGLPVAEPPE